MLRARTPIFILIALLLAAQSLYAQQAPPEISRGVMLLRNGQIIEGKISRFDDYYQVTSPDEELRVRAAEVECICRTLEEGYEHKRAIVQPGNIQDHLQLAQWCQRHGLLSCAANELASAVEIDPGHPMIAILQRRLKMAVETPQDPAQPAKPAARIPTPEELDHMVRGMPPGTVEAFVQVVQPILMNDCTTSGCHGTQSPSRFQLLRGATGQLPNRRITQRNLYAVLQWVNWDKPNASPLLTAPRGPHGPSQTPIFADHRAMQCRRMTEWVYEVAQRSMPQDTEVRQASAFEPINEPASPANPPASKPRLRLRPPPAAQRPAEPPDKPAAATPPADPYDASGFNGQPTDTNRPPAPVGGMATPAARAMQGK
jgi:hypothetical protein